MNVRFGPPRLHWLCRLIGHRWDPWMNTVRGDEQRFCRRGCTYSEHRVPTVIEV